jgi:hypothetical protein
MTTPGIIGIKGAPKMGRFFCLYTSFVGVGYIHLLARLFSLFNTCFIFSDMANETGYFSPGIKPYDSNRGAKKRSL